MNVSPSNVDWAYISLGGEQPIAIEGVLECGNLVVDGNIWGRRITTGTGRIRAANGELVQVTINSTYSLLGYSSGTATIDDLAGLSRTRPMGALAMTVFLLSLIGLPPTAGFLGKLNLLMTAWSATNPLPNMPDARWLAVVLIAGAAIGAFYYLRLIGAMYLGQPTDSQESVGPMDVPAAIGVACCAAATILLFAAPNLIWPWIQQI